VPLPNRPLSWLRVSSAAVDRHARDSRCGAIRRERLQVETAIVGEFGELAGPGALGEIWGLAAGGEHEIASNRMCGNIDQNPLSFDRDTRASRNDDNSTHR